MQNLQKEFSSREQSVKFTNMNAKVRNTLKTVIPDLQEVRIFSSDDESTVSFLILKIVYSKFNKFGFLF